MPQVGMYDYKIDVPMGGPYCSLRPFGRRLPLYDERETRTVRLELLRARLEESERERKK